MAVPLAFVLSAELRNVGEDITGHLGARSMKRLG